MKALNYPANLSMNSFRYEGVLIDCALIDRLILKYYYKHSYVNLKYRLNLNYNVNNINILATKRRANMTLNNRAIVFIMLVKTIMVFKSIFPINYLISVAVLHNLNVSSFPLEHLITVANT